MKILLMEGNDLVREAFFKNYNSPSKTIITVSNLYDGIYNLLYADTEFDIVIVGDELETSVETTSLEADLGALLQGLKDCIYFPVKFGEICIELYKKKRKKEPKIVVFTTCEAYEFRIQKTEMHSSMNISKEIQHFVENNGMLLVDKTDVDFLETFRRILK